MTADPIAAFIDYQGSYHGVSEERLKMTTRVLRSLEAEAGDITQIEPDDLTEFLADPNLAASTINKHLKAVRPFVRWMHMTDRIDAERMIRLLAVPPPRSARSLPKPYTRKQVARLWGELEAAYPFVRLNWQDRKRGRKPTRELGEFYVYRYVRGQSRWSRARPFYRRVQMEAIVSLALHGGLRCREIFELQVEDLHPDNEYVVVHSAAKNPRAESRDRAVPWMTDEMRGAVRWWLELRESLGPAHEGAWLALDHSDPTGPMGWEGFRVLMARMGSGWEYHRLRHTMATESLRAGVPLEQLSRILGHSRIEQTLQYAEIVEGDVVKAAERAEQRFARAVGRPERVMA